MSRLSFRPRPLDIHKKLPILKSVQDFEDEDTPASTRNWLLRFNAAEGDNEVHHIHNKKLSAEIPTPQFDIVGSYEAAYCCTFVQPASYLHARGVRAELGEFVEYDLDNEDEDWLNAFNKETEKISFENFEYFLFKFEVLDHKARERIGAITSTFGSPIPVLLQLDAANEALQVHAQLFSNGVFRSVFEYWKRKRGKWRKPILRRLQPPPAVNDTNPYNVFRPREKAHRLHTRRMQRRENNVQSFEKLRQVRRNLSEAKGIVNMLSKREEKKREAIENEIKFQRARMIYKHESQLLVDGLSLGLFQSLLPKTVSSEDDFIDSDEPSNSYPGIYMPSAQNLNIVKHASRLQNSSHEWFRRVDPLAPVMLFTKPIVPEKLAAAGIVPPIVSTLKSGASRLRGRIGRGGRIVFDRWNPLSLTFGDHNSYMR